MAEYIAIPKLGMSMTEATLVEGGGCPDDRDGEDRVGGRGSCVWASAYPGG